MVNQKKQKVNPEQVQRLLLRDPDVKRIASKHMRHLQISDLPIHGKKFRQEMDTFFMAYIQMIIRSIL